MKLSLVTQGWLSAELHCIIDDVISGKSQLAYYMTAREIEAYISDLQELLQFLRNPDITELTISKE